jgi:site-specific recombinase XerD
MTGQVVSELFETFLRERLYVQNLAPATVHFYKRSFKAFGLPAQLSELNQTTLNDCVVKLRARGLSANCTNAYIRGTRPFIFWLHENGHLKEKLKLRKLKCVNRELKTFSESDIQKLLQYRPRKVSEFRLVALVNLLTDSGIRIQESLNLRRQDIDFDNLLIDVVGKGRFRRIAISPECRAVLFKYLKTHNFELVFCNRDGCRVNYSNLRRDFVELCDKLGITDFDAAFHAFRAFHASYSSLQGVSPFVLMKQLGHSQISTTQKYVRLSQQQIQSQHVSLLKARAAANGGTH